MPSLVARSGAALPAVPQSRVLRGAWLMPGPRDGDTSAYLAPRIPRLISRSYRHSLMQSIDGKRRPVDYSALGQPVRCRRRRRDPEGQTCQRYTFNALLPATNVFIKHDRHWLMVHHHSSRPPQ
jgi:hypothetical protein